MRIKVLRKSEDKAFWSLKPHKNCFSVYLLNLPKIQDFLKFLHKICLKQQAKLDIRLNDYNF